MIDAARLSAASVAPFDNEPQCPAFHVEVQPMTGLLP